jgi:hypothetical protein
LARNLQSKSRCWGQCEENKSKTNRKKALKSPAMKQQQILPKVVNNGESQRFFGRC